MTHLYIYLCILLLLSGCISPGIVPPKEVTGKDKEVYIVAMEPHPLGVPLKFNTVIFGSGGSMQMARGFALFNTIGMLAQLPEVSKEGEQRSQSYQVVLDQGGIWIPTLALAKETQAQLISHGFQTMVAPYIKPVPGVKDRSYNLIMENWLAPIREWYSDTSPVGDYRDIPHDKPFYVLEVGMINYEIGTDGELLVQVAMKVIDPSSGKVIGRARAFNLLNRPQLGSLDEAFSKDAARFKEVFAKMSQVITQKCLVDLGLIQPASE